MRGGQNREVYVGKRKERVYNKEYGKGKNESEEYKYKEQSLIYVCI